MPPEKKIPIIYPVQAHGAAATRARAPRATAAAALAPGGARARRGIGDPGDVVWTLSVTPERYPCAPSVSRVYGLVSLSLIPYL